MRKNRYQLMRFHPSDKALKRTTAVVAAVTIAASGALLGASIASQKSKANKCSAALTSEVKSLLREVLTDAGNPAIWSLDLDNTVTGVNYTLTEQQMQQLLVPANLGLVLKGNGITVNGVPVGQIQTTMNFYTYGVSSGKQSVTCKST
jgi:hypothetical protein